MLPSNNPMSDDHPSNKVNIPLLKKAVEWAEAEAAKPDQTMSRWFQDRYVTNPVTIDRSPECGTCFCIAGYVADLTLRPGERITDCAGIYRGDEFVTTVDARAEAVLGGNVYAESNNRSFSGEDLFFSGNTIEDVRRIAELLAGERL